MTFELTRECPTNIIVFNNGISVIDYSDSKTIYCAYEKHTKNHKDYENNMLNYFKTYTRDEILNLVVKHDQKWPLYFGWVKYHENRQCS